MTEGEDNPQMKKTDDTSVNSACGHKPLRPPSQNSKLGVHIKLAVFKALPASRRPCPLREVNYVCDVLIIDIWHFTLWLAGKVLTRCYRKCMGGNHLHSHNNNWEDF